MHHHTRATLVLALVASACGSFDGIRGVGNFMPVGTSVAVSTERIVQVADRRMRIWARDAQRTLVADLRTWDLFSPLLCPAAVDGIPICDSLWVGNARVRFDAATGRWFLLTAASRSTGRWLLAVSRTALPEAGWWLYAFAPQAAWFGSQFGTLSAFPDYPGLGVGSDTVLLTGNLADEVLGLAYVEQSAVLLVNKAHLLAGSAAATAYFHPARSAQKLWLLQPSHHDGGGAGQVAAGINVMTTQGTILRVQALHGVPGTAATPSMTMHEITPDANAPFRNPPPARQPGPAHLPLIDQRVLDVAYRAGQLWVALHQGCYPVDDVDWDGAPVKRACARYLRLEPGSFALREDVRLRERRQYYFLPALALDDQGTLLSNVVRSSEDEYASVYLTGRRASDPPSTLRLPRRVRAGRAAYADVPGPWGEFNGAAADPADTGAWFSTAYPETAVEWGTWNGTVHAAEYPQ